MHVIIVFVLQVHKAEDEKYSELKSELRGELGELRQTLLGIIDANERAPDMEKLGREEFILDMEEHDRLQAEEAEQIQQVSATAYTVPLRLYPSHCMVCVCVCVCVCVQVKEEIELSNLAKMFLREQIKRECWNSMSVKGKVIKVSFSLSPPPPPPPNTKCKIHIVVSQSMFCLFFCLSVCLQGFQGTLEVSNYPMMSRSEQDQRELARVRTLRAIELADRAVGTHTHTHTQSCI